MPKTITKKCNVYRFQELSEEQKQKVFQENWSILVESFDTMEETSLATNWKLESRTWLDMDGYEVYHDGRGSSWLSGAEIDLVAWMKSKKICNKFRAFYHAAKNDEIDVYVHEERYGTRHWTSVELDSTWYCERTEIQEKRLDSQIAECQELLLQDLNEFSDDVMSAVKKEYDYMQSTEGLRDYFDNSFEGWINEDGTIYSYWDE